MSRQQVMNPTPQSQRPPPLPPHPSQQPREDSRSSISSNLQHTPPPPPPPPKQQLEADTNGIPKPSPLGRYDAPPPLPNAARSASSQSTQSIPISPQNQSSQFMPQRNTSLRHSMIIQPFQPQQNFNKPTPPQGSPLRHSSSTAGVRTPHFTGTKLTLEAQPLYSQSLQSAPMLQNVPQDPAHSQLQPSHIPPNIPQSRNAPVHYQQQPAHPGPTPQPKPTPVNLLDSPFDINLPLSSANIPAPPIPPNPEKDALLSALSQSITQTLHHDMSQNAASLPLLRSQREALNDPLRTLESELAQLQALQSTLSGNVSILQSSLREADKCISSAHARSQRGEIPKIDDMLTAPTVVGKQLYDVVCDERGIEAAIWALQAALTRGRISIDVWAKKTRELSREGFKRKVLSGKIARGMGLEE
jgi:ESCRT-I complex subunit TSG101